MIWTGVARRGTLMPIMRIDLAVMVALSVILFRAEPVRAQQVAVDVELLLAVDASYSMSARERDIQRRGYAEALTSPEVIDAIQSGHLGRIAVSYMEWAGSVDQLVLLDWMLIEDINDAYRAAAILLRHSRSAMRRTSISGALDTGVALMASNGFSGRRRVIDISGDGPNNQGGPVTAARDRALAAGIVINGLPLMTREGRGSAFGIDDLDEYYRRCVTGGPASFVIPVTGWESFPDAVRRKLVLEITENTPNTKPLPAAFHKKVFYDCLVGEKIWERLRRNWLLE